MDTPTYQYTELAVKGFDLHKFFNMNVTALHEQLSNTTVVSPTFLRRRREQVQRRAELPARLLYHMRTEIGGISLSSIVSLFLH